MKEVELFKGILNICETTKPYRDGDFDWYNDKLFDELNGRFGSVDWTLKFRIQDELTKTSR